MIYAGRIRFKPYLNPIKLQGGPFQRVITILSALILQSWELSFDSDRVTVYP